MDDCLQRRYLDILREELVPAMGCTEPIAIAYAAAVSAACLNGMIRRIQVACSSNVMKNARSAFVPHTGGRKGIAAAAIAGAFAGNGRKGLEVLADIDSAALEHLEPLFEKNLCAIVRLDSARLLHIVVTLWSDEDEASVEIMDHHTNIVRITRNGHTLMNKASTDGGTEVEDGDWAMNVDDILSFCETVPLEEISGILQRQIDCNMAIACEGLSGRYGVAIAGCYDHNDLNQRMKAYTAAASEARMSGCELPVVINSGSGNQGISASVPVIIYSREKGISPEQTYRALALSNLLAIRQKKVIGSLSAFCGAVSATCASGAAIAYLESGGDWDAVRRTITNTLANVSGIVCDGAKPSCAAKISSGLEAAMLGCKLALSNRAYSACDGIVMGSVEDTIDAVGMMAREGMAQTDQVLFQIMVRECNEASQECLCQR